MSSRYYESEMRGESDEEGHRLDVLDLRSNKIPKLVWVVMYILGLVGIVLIGISCGCMVYNPISKQEYLNNIQLQKSIEVWETQRLADKFKSFHLQMGVRSFYEERAIESVHFRETDPHFNLTIRSGFYEKVFSNNGFLFGLFEFQQFNVPLGDSAEYCISLRYYNKIMKTIYHKNKCILYSNNQINSIQTIGIKIQPWQQIKRQCNDCVCLNGIIQQIDGHPFCFQYNILSSVCVVVRINSIKQVEYVHGCYKNNLHQVFRMAHTHERTSFEDLTIQIREVRDPYINALALSKNDTPIYFENANFPDVIRLIFEVGFGLLSFVVMLNLAYKANRSPSTNLKRTRINSIIYLKDQ